MIWTVTRWTLKQRRNWIIWWCIGVLAFLALSLGFYPAVKDQAAQLNEALREIPQGVRSFITDQADILSPKGFLSSRVFYLLLPLILSVLTISLGNSLIAREEDEKTIELILSRPVSRGHFILGKAFAGLLAAAIIGATALVGIIFISWLVGIDVPLGSIALATLLCLLFVVSLGSIAFYMSALGRRSRLSGVGLAVLAGLGSYIVSSLTGVVEWLTWPDKFLPYHYYRPSEVLSGLYDWRRAGLFIVATLFFGILSWLSFRHRDIAT
jgi:ABC-2 type transport system permease protein